MLYVCTRGNPNIITLNVALFISDQEEYIKMPEVSHDVLFGKLKMKHNNQSIEVFLTCTYFALP